MTKKQFVTRLKDLRRQSGLPQKTVTTALNIVSRTYEYYESDKNSRIPEYKNLIKLANFFNCSIDYLLCQTDNPKRNY